MKYFISVVNFVDQHILWVVGLFLLASIVELIVFLCKKKGGKFDTDGFFICIATNLTITIGLYILACLGVGLVNCLRDQNYHFWSNYLTFLSNGGIVILGIIFIGSGIFFLFKYSIDSFLGRLIAAAVSAALATGVAFIAGLLIYIVIAIVIIILKVLWFVVSGFFISIFEFVVKYWKMSTVVLLGPGIIYGACCAFANYIRSFKDEVVHK